MALLLLQPYGYKINEWERGNLTSKRGRTKLSFWLPLEVMKQAIAVTNPWETHNLSDILLFFLTISFLQTWTNVIQQFPSVTSTPSAWTPSVLTVVRVKQVLMEMEKNVSVSLNNDFHYCLKKSISKQSKTIAIPGLIWRFDLKLL